MTPDQQTKEQAKPKSNFLFAALMGVAAAVAAFALGIISTIPGMKWLSAVSLSSSHALDWRLGLLNTYAAMHVKLVGSGMIDSGLGAEKVSASIVMPPTLLTVAIGVCLLVAAVLTGRSLGPSLFRRLVALLLAVLACVAVLVAVSPLAHSRLDGISLPSTEEFNFSPPQVEYRPTVTSDAFFGWSLALLTMLGIGISGAGERVGKPGSEAPSDRAAKQSRFRLPAVMRVVLRFQAVLLLLIAILASVALLYSGSARQQDAESAGPGTGISAAMAPAVTAGYLLFSGYRITVTAQGINLSTGEKSTLLDMNADIRDGVETATNDRAEVKETQVPKWVWLGSLLIWGVMWFLVARLLPVEMLLSDTIKCMGLLWVAVSALTVCEGLASQLFKAEFARTDAEMSRSIITFVAHPHYMPEISIPVMAVALVLGNYSASRSRNRKQAA